MIALILSFLFICTSAITESQGKQLEQSSRRPKLGRLLRNSHQRRLLQGNDSCTFEKLMDKSCHLWEFCTDLTFGDSVEVRCGGNIDADWYIFMEGEETCYNDLLDEEGFARSSRSLPPAGYCSNERGFLNFTRSELVYSDVSEIITAPEEIKGTLHEVYSISECQLKNPILADYYFGRTFCDDPCPYQVQVGGLDCDKQCSECSNGMMVLNCAEIGLVERCEAIDNTYLYEAYFHYFQETNRLEEKSRSKENVVDIVNVEPELAASAAAKTSMWMASMMIVLCAMYF